MTVEEWLGKENQLGIDIYNKKYRYNNETFDEWLDRVSGNDDDVKQLIIEKKLLFGGRTLSNRGTGKNASYSNCYSSGYVPDSLEGIMDLNKNIALTYKSQGGQGLSLSKIRPKNAGVKNGQFTSDGIVPFMELFNQTTASVSQGGSRKGALMMSLSCTHKEIETFITIKSGADKIAKANLSVEISDEFMEAVDTYYKTGEIVDLCIKENYEDNIVEYSIKPIEIYKMTIKESYDWAEPACLYTNRFRNYNLMQYCDDYEIVTGNPSMPKDVLVATTDGIVNINMLEGKNFYVKSLSGEIAPAECWLSSDNADVYDIDFGGGRNTYATQKHKFPVLVNGEIIRKEVSELQSGDLIPLNRNELQGYSNTLTEDYGFLAGVFLSESSITKRKEYNGYVCMLSIGKDDIGVKERIDDIYKKITNENLKFRDRNGTYEATITNKYFIEEILINKLGLSLSCDGKKVPNTVWDSGDNFVLGFIDGLFSTDGNIKLVNNGRNVKAQLQLTTSLDSVAKDIQMLLGFYGISSTLYARDRKCTFPNGKDYEKTYHSVELNMSPIQSVRFCNIFKLTCSSKWDRLYNNLTKKGVDKKNASHIKIKSVTLRSTEPVWDISVYHSQHVFPSQHCYTGNCGEQPLPKNGACNLGSINLSAFVENPFENDAYFNYDDFEFAVETSIEALDNILTDGMDLHALKEQREMAKNYRNIGLGIMGLGDMFFKLGLKYGSEKSKQVLNDVMHFMFTTSIYASNRLAETYGTFPMYNEKIWESDIIKNHFQDIQITRLKKHGIRNCSLLSIAPSGSIGTMISVTTGIEPAFQISYKRKTESLHKDKDVYYDVYLETAKEYMKKYNTDKLPDYFVASGDIDWRDRVDIQAVAQNHIDTAISSTVNLPNEITLDEVEQLYLYSWSAGLKGITIYRDGCSRSGILTTTDSKTKTTETPTTQENTLPWGTVIQLSDDLIGRKRKVMSGCGAIHVQAFFDEDTGKMMEVYLAKGSNGGCNSFLISNSRMISLALRTGAPLETIVDQLKSSPSCPSYAVRTATKKDTSMGNCCPTALANALLDMQKQIDYELGFNNDNTVKLTKKEVGTLDNVSNKALCPECQEELRFEGGCNSCISCGYSKCS